MEKKSREPKIIAAGHICLDITPAFPDKAVENVGDILMPGRLIQMGAADVHTGGSVSNTGLALKILGADVSLMGKIGNDAFGELVYSQFKEYDAQEGLIVSDDVNTSYSVVVAPKGIDRIFLHHSGANNMFYKKDLDFSKIEEATLFHFGYPPLMQSMYENDGSELTDMFREVKEHGVFTSMDMAAVDENSPSGKADWDKILKNVLPYIDFFVPSVEELAYMIDRERFCEWQERAAGKDICTVLDVETDIRPLAEKLIGYGAKVVLIKCGAPGLFLATADSEQLTEMEDLLAGGAAQWANLRIFEKSYKPDRVLSGTGAGDTSIAAFLYAVVTGHSYGECLQLAAATGASCVAAYDALSGLKSFDELKEKIKNGWEKNGEK
ncbi:MAG: carbohydrate kinase family protein [Roseburia sp.]|nr:carbohydrate kinase family protein [Roseburia sp.]